MATFRLIFPVLACAAMVSSCDQAPNQASEQPVQNDAEQTNAPVLQNSGPIIYLADNLDEKDQLGYCVDTQERGQTERIQLHSCKPDGDDANDRDVLFSLNSETGRIEHAEYDGYCCKRTWIGNGSRTV